jgi:hypothetical protein
MRTRRSGVCCLLLVAACVLAVSAEAAMAQESRSAPLAKQLTGLLDKAKLDAIAAKEAGEKDHYVAALYFSGSQLLVIEARYSVPVLLDEKLAKRDFREIYMDLNSASAPESRVFIVDLGANGLMPKRDENQPYDTYEAGPKRVQFDGDWKKQQLTEEEYMKLFAAADAEYAKMLTSLIGQAKK